MSDPHSQVPTNETRQAKTAKEQCNPYLHFHIVRIAVDPRKGVIPARNYSITRTNKTSTQPARIIVSSALVL